MRWVYEKSKIMHPYLQYNRYKRITKKKYIELISKMFWIKVDKTKTCWNWLGGLNDYGYGRFHFNGKRWKAHHVSLILNGTKEKFLNNLFSNGKCIDHICRNRKCVNPSHLRVLTLIENVMVGESPIAKKAFRTHCPNGHEFIGDNFYMKTSTKGRRPYRVCRICRL